MPAELSVIAPCLNEEDNIVPLVERCLATFDRLPVKAELVLVDDGSSDGTWGAIGDCSKRDARIRGVQHASNRGLESAWRSGLRAAHAPLICLIDSDLQNRPEDIAQLYEAYQGIDLVQGVRIPSAGMRRLLFSRALSFLLNVSFRMNLRDNKSGFVLCRREVLESLLSHRFRYRYFQSFLGVAAGARGYRVTEVDTVFDLRQSGQSFLPRLPLLTSLRILWELLKFRVESFRPAPSKSAGTGVSQPSPTDESSAHRENRTQAR